MNRPTTIAPETGKVHCPMCTHTVDAQLEHHSRYPVETGAEVSPLRGVARRGLDYARPQGRLRHANLLHWSRETETYAYSQRSGDADYPRGAHRRS